MISSFKETILFCILFCACQIGMAVPIEIDRLFCEYLLTPQSVDSYEPVLSWMLKSDQRGQKQTAYQVLVADCEQLLVDNNLMNQEYMDEST